MVEYYENEAALDAALKRRKRRRRCARSSRTWSSAWPLGIGKTRLLRHSVPCLDAKLNRDGEVSMPDRAERGK